jgi:hypothetical protein
MLKDSEADKLNDKLKNKIKQNENVKNLKKYILFIIEIVRNK